MDDNAKGVITVLTFYRCTSFIPTAMERGIRQFLLIALALFSVVTGEDTRLEITKIDIKNVNNPFFGAWSAEVHDNGEKISVKMPIKQNVPENMMVRAKMELSGDSVPEKEMTLCEGFADETVGKDILSAGIPKGEFPEGCPLGPGSNFEISKYLIPQDKVSDIPPGDFIGDFTIYEPGMEPHIIIHVEGIFKN